MGETINETPICSHPESRRAYNATLRALQCLDCSSLIDLDTERVQMNVRVPRSVMLRARNESQRRMVSINVLVERAMTELLDRLESESL